MTKQEFTSGLPEDAVAIILTADEDNLNITMCNSLSENTDEEEYEWLLNLQQGLASALQVNMPHIMELGEAAIASYEEGVAEMFMEFISQQSKKEKPKKKTKKSGTVVNLFDKKEENENGKD
jgi:hypothetical protein